MSAAWHYFLLSAPLFVLVLVGYLVALWRRWRQEWTALGARLVFAVLLPALLFGMLSDLSALPPVDARLLLAFFGGCFVVFMMGRWLAVHLFDLDGVAQSVFALGGIFSNNVLLGLPIARLTLGEEAVPSVALVLVFNSLTLWTLVTVSVEWARHGSFTAQGFARTALSVLTNPIVAAIVAGTLLGLSGLHLPHAARFALDHIGSLAAPAALLVLGMGLAAYEIRREWHLSTVLCVLKLLVQPAVVWVIGALIGLPIMELKVVVLLASMAVGANVYLMAVQFDRLQGTIATSLVLSTAFAAFTTPLLLAAMNALVG
jgi:predicted permease